MSRICAILFVLLATGCCLGAIAVTIVSFYSCLLMQPYTQNCSIYLGYNKFCCRPGICGYSQCTIYMYSGGAIAAQACLWFGFVVFAGIAHCCFRRSRQDDGFGQGIQMNMTNSPMGYGTPVY